MRQRSTTFAVAFLLLMSLTLPLPFYDAWAQSEEMPASRIEGHWTLVRATDHEGRKIKGLRVNAQHVLRLWFTDTGVTRSGGCNDTGAFYRYGHGVLERYNGAITAVGCHDKRLEQLDDKADRLLSGKLQVAFNETSGKNQLTLINANGDTLVFARDAD